ncbi:hypothetical protein RFI_24682 [Reticulomyxa filosa]|uniref:Uncharacterized protein n=1 Tax=Reticulomyxa filosa TaxID=46433 RepID=X6MGY2_RETFI|nr:hypothetical protein RFI_24682 [Reticulomyxa filosa]|eukprot:ETO12692.1 hypothetical protein RFI_24682 [Reticulomyxa filosa]
MHNTSCLPFDDFHDHQNGENRQLEPVTSNEHSIFSDTTSKSNPSRWKISTYEKESHSMDPHSFLVCNDYTVSIMSLNHTEADKMNRVVGGSLFTVKDKTITNTSSHRKLINPLNRMIDIAKIQISSIRIPKMGQSPTEFPITGTPVIAVTNTPIAVSSTPVIVATDTPITNTSSSSPVSHPPLFKTNFGRKHTSVGKVDRFLAFVLIPFCFNFFYFDIFISDISQKKKKGGKRRVTPYCFGNDFFFWLRYCLNFSFIHCFSPFFHNIQMRKLTKKTINTQNDLQKEKKDRKNIELEAEIKQMEQQILDSGGSELQNQKI